MPTRVRYRTQVNEAGTKYTCERLSQEVDEELQKLVEGLVVCETRVRHGGQGNFPRAACLPITAADEQTAITAQ